MTKQDWFDYFNRKKSEYVPLVVTVANPDMPAYTIAEMMNEPQKAVEHFAAKWKYTVEVGSDFAEMAESNFLENLIPCIFGAKTNYSPGGLIDVKPFIKDIYETENINTPDIFCEGTEKAAAHLEYMRDNLPRNIYLNPSRFMSPLDYAVVMRGGDFYMELAAEPELAVNFMNKIADVTISAIKYFKAIIKQPLNESVTIRGIPFPGIRLTGDAVVNLSPKMIKDIMCPLYKRFEAEFGACMLHYCCAPAPSGHVIGALGEGGGVSCMDNWQGYKTIFNGNETQTDVGVCTDVDMASILNGEIFTDSFFQKNERPLVVGTTARSVEEGKQIYNAWRQKSPLPERVC